MKDSATSDDPAVQAQLDRLAALSLPQGRFGLETIAELCNRLGNPERRLPPVFHVAGTNGKGSTCAFLRAALEAAGHRVHVYTSPHLVRFNERIRLGGRLIDDALLASLLEDVLDAGADLGPSFFEVATAAAFVAFARVPAEACVVEVGLGGRFDATNVIPAPAVCGIASLGIDHEAFLLAPDDKAPQDPIARIAFEKAGIAKRGVPLVTLAYPEVAEAAVSATADRLGARLVHRGHAWSATVGETIAYSDRHGALDLPLPMMPGVHQADNAALAVAMLRHQQVVEVPSEAIAEGIRAARWPARLQLLSPGPLTALVPGRRVWLDGGHNPDAGAAIARHFVGERVDLILGMLANKDPRALVEPLRNAIASLIVVPVPGHDAHPASAFGPHARVADDVAGALAALPPGNRDILVAGSLYLAGAVLAANGEAPE